MFGITHAPDFDHPGLIWFNTRGPISLADLRGRLVILDFWTFCCVNCLHTLPVLRLIEDTFGENVAVIGVHSPKFTHECHAESVAKAIQRYDIRHPVVHDPQTILWDEYCVRAWPSLVFISPDGMVIGQLTGEPDPDMLLNGVAAMLEQFRHEGQLCHTPLGQILAASLHQGGALRFPGKIKPCPDRDGTKRWAIADSGHHQIVFLDDGGRELRRWGSGRPGFADGSIDACFNGPEGLICDEAAIYVADTRNHAIRRIDIASGFITTLAGDGRRGGALCMEGAPPETSLASPWDLALWQGSVYFANAGSHQIGRLDLADGIIHLVAGSGAEDIVDGPGEHALLAQPSGLALCPSGDCLYLTDAETSSVRRLSLDGSARISTVTGSGLYEYGDADGDCDHASFQHPLGLTMAGERLLVADSYNSALRMVDLAAATVTSIKPRCRDDVCIPWAEPAGIAADGPDRLLLSDTNNHRIVEINLADLTSRTWFG
ncbi:hypothetical protein CU669_17590 [Paramagnetospirillum kuznetsovii]|uniref:Thioredoxin domain-containing protein n=1 Tax=Paramagnetospirillum kuznetsovii TaxID=2053833 RepID=A0A364NU00_9PROT|nr:redoxin domain-containing protein [Paramagnetospirillum kuznetsovii]RAU20558.1 hypothetical protein CU669_17590 [Paramagnetospirillum kuznetsovii]